MLAGFQMTPAQMRLYQERAATPHDVAGGGAVARRRARRSPPKAWPRAFGQVQVVRPARPGAVPVQWRAGGGESSQSQSPRHRREDRRAAEKPTRISPRSRSPDPAFINLDLTDAALDARIAGAPMLAPEAGNGKTAGDRFRRPQYRQAHACGSSALLHHRRLPAAAVTAPMAGR